MISPPPPCTIYSDALTPKPLFEEPVLSEGGRQSKPLSLMVLLFFTYFQAAFQSHLLYFLRCPWYSSQMGQFAIPTFSSSSLYLCAGSFLAGKGLLLLIFQSPSQSQFLHWFCLIILTRHDLLALTSSDPLVLSYFSNTNLVPDKQNRGLLNKWVLNEWAAVN